MVTETCVRIKRAMICEVYEADGVALHHHKIFDIHEERDIIIARSERKLCQSLIS